MSVKFRPWTRSYWLRLRHFNIQNTVVAFNTSFDMCNKYGKWVQTLINFLIMKSANQIAGSLSVHEGRLHISSATMRRMKQRLLFLIGFPIGGVWKAYKVWQGGGGVEKTTKIADVLYGRSLNIFSSVVLFWLNSI